MPVNSLHLEYQQWAPEWRKCRDVYNGSTAVKKAGIRYLPQLTEQTETEYGAYKQRALFYSITGKSVSALVGMSLARPPILKYPDQMADYFVENSGTQFYEALGTSIAEILLTGRYGILIDRQTLNGRPEIHGYKTESIINWKTNRDGKAFLVVLLENVYDPLESDEFDHVLRQQYRVLRLQPKDQVMSNAVMSIGLLSDYAMLPIVNETGSDWIYTVSVHDHQGQFVSTVVPTNDGRPMNVIPFYVGTPLGIGFEIHRPPMLDIAEINISHYQTSADLEHGRHFTGLPTAVVSGLDPNTKLKIGSTTAWILPDANCRASYLEFTGQGLASLENALKEKQTQMASLASRVMDNSGNGSEAADAVRLRYMSESASLSSIVRTGEAMMMLAYTTIAAMQTFDASKIQITLEKEFHNGRLSAADIASLTETYLTGGMSVESYVFNLRRGDAYDPARDDSIEIEELKRLKAALDVANAAKAAAVANPAVTKP